MLELYSSDTKRTISGTARHDAIRGKKFPTYEKYLYNVKHKSPYTDWMSSVKNADQRQDNGEAWSTLELNYKRFTVLPVFITEEPYAKYIQRLYLKRNFLMSLPDDVDRIINLVLLYVPSNNLKTLPESIGKLQQLECLNVDSNQLSALPASIGELKSLRKLQASRNDLSLLPVSIGRLASLTTLEVMFNKLTTLPREIGQLKSLEVLNVDSNHIDVLPKELCQLDNLLELSACSNELLYLPPGLTWMKKLTYLLVDNNRMLNCVPSCPQIAELGITGCGVSQFHPKVLHDFLHITIKSNHYHGNPVILFSPDIQIIGNNGDRNIPVLKELCLRLIYGRVKHLAVTGLLEFKHHLENILPRYLTAILDEPSTRCSQCKMEVFLMAYPIVHLKVSNSSRILVMDLCCTLTCLKKYSSTRKTELSFIYPDLT